MNDQDLSDSNKAKRKLPSQSSPEDTTNWENRAIALPNPKRPLTVFIMAEDNTDSVAIYPIINPYLEQERLKSVGSKK